MDAIATIEFINVEQCPIMHPCQPYHSGIPTMTMLKRLFQQTRPAPKPAAPAVPEHPNFWMYQ
jgi:hypothetical protein